MVPGKIFHHRINTLEQLKAVDRNFGIEVDLRSESGDVILSHDPFCKGENLENYLKCYSHSGIILNTKEEGLEMRLIDLMSKLEISEYFFLDLSLPFLVKTIKNGCNKVAVRFSEYEPLEYVSKFEGLAEWVWVDCFTANVLSPESYAYLHKYFKICIVSPELQGHPIDWIADFRLAFENFKIDAVCTKIPESWQ
jgi:hypothetical protein